MAAKIWDETCEALACGITSIANLFEPELVVLGGGVVRTGEQLLGPVRERIAEQVIGRPRDDRRCRVGRLGRRRRRRCCCVRACPGRMPLSEHAALLARVEELLPRVDDVAQRLISCFGAGGRVYTFGNGGSSADAAHFAEELLGRFKRERRPLPAQSLSIDAAALTCIANDYSFDEVFERQVRGFVRADDVVIGFSTSGRSTNVVRGARRRAGARRGDGPVRRRRSRGRPRRRRLEIPSDSTARIQEMHVLLLHLILEQVDAWAAAVNKEKRLHMIGNAHIDPVWLWQWPEGYQEVRATFQSAVDRLDDYPEYVFTCDSSLFFSWVEESDPALFERIRAHVRSGRFQVIGGWWIEPDCNIPGGESFVRQALYGQRYLHETFGVTATTGANIDSFGHNATIPQVLAKSGCDSYVFLRPGPKEKELPALFRWESPDGSFVRAYRIPHEYLAPKDDIGEHVETAVGTLPDDGEEWAVFYGVGNHGGGPTIANLEQIRTMGLQPSSLRAFFDGVNGRELPDGSRRATAPWARLLHVALRDQALEPPHGASAAARGEVERGRGVARLAALSARGARAGVEAPALQPVPRHAGRDVDRPGVRRRARPAGPCVVARGECVQCGGAVDLAADPRRARGRHPPGRRLQPSSMACQHRRRDRVHVDARHRREHLRRGRRASADAAHTRTDDDEQHAGAACVPVELPPLGYRTYRVRPWSRQAAEPCWRTSI